MLEYEYEKCGSMQKMADKLNVSIDSIAKYMNLYSVCYAKNYKGIYSCNDNSFSNDSEHSFYWAGFLAADGSLQKRKHSKILKLTLSEKDLSHLEKFKFFIQSNNPIKKYTIKPTSLVKSVNYCVEIQIVSNKIYDDLSRFNIVPNKTKTYEFPEWMIGHDLINHFMRGYFDGDGCISRCGLHSGRSVAQGYFSILGTKDFVEKYKLVLESQAELKTNKVCKKSSIFTVSYSGNNNIKKIYNFLYKNCNIFLERKRNKILNFI
jgi:hypothetical protein